MTARELDAEALERRAVPLVLRRGSLRLKPDTPADALLVAFAAAATEQLVLSVPPPPPPTAAAPPPGLGLGGKEGKEGKAATEEDGEE